MYVYTYIYVCIYSCVCMYVCMYVCMHVYVSIYACMYVCMCGMYAHMYSTYVPKHTATFPAYLNLRMCVSQKTHLHAYIAHLILTRVTDTRRTHEYPPCQDMPLGGSSKHPPLRHSGRMHAHTLLVSCVLRTLACRCTCTPTLWAATWVCVGIYLVSVAS
jgi:hypothetical protein